jgi:hypothetical protein
MTNLPQRALTKTQHIIVTGLSRSGKSTLLTSMMAHLSHHAEQAQLINKLPLLDKMANNRLVDAKLTSWKDEKIFPYEAQITALQQRQWPESTKEISAFALTLTLKRKNVLAQRLLGNQQLQLVIHDYPGEWLMDLPMIDQSYQDWSAHVFAQQSSEPQHSLAKAWLACVHDFDFTLPTTPVYTNHLIESYQRYLLEAKRNGMTRLQPGALLLHPPTPRATLGRFCPLPAKILAQPDHPWVLFFAQAYHDYKQNWLLPLREKYFKHSNKQVILVDLLEGLNYGKHYLAEMQEALTHLTQSFVYGKRRWYERLHKPISIDQVIFVATKVDLVPIKEQTNLRALLENMTQSAQNTLAQHHVEVVHLLLAAITTTKPVENAEDSLIYKHISGETRQVSFDPIPTRIQDLSENGRYPFLPSQPPLIKTASDLHAMHLDQLINRLLKDNL